MAFAAQPVSGTWAFENNYSTYKYMTLEVYPKGSCIEGACIKDEDDDDDEAETEDPETETDEADDDDQQTEDQDESDIEDAQFFQEVVQLIDDTLPKAISVVSGLVYEQRVNDIFF